MVNSKTTTTTTVIVYDEYMFENCPISVKISFIAAYKIVKREHTILCRQPSHYPHARVSNDCTTVDVVERTEFNNAQRVCYVTVQDIGFITTLQKYG